MLALTESRKSQPRISAAALGNPLADWTALPPNDKGPYGSNGKKYGAVSHAPYQSDGVTRIHPDSTVERDWNQADVADQPRNIPVRVQDLLTLRCSLFRKPEGYFDPFASPLLFFRTPSLNVPLEDPSQTSSSGGPETEANLLVTTRRSHRHFPPTGSNIFLPHLRVDVGEENALNDQGADLVALIRRNHSRMVMSGIPAEFRERRFDLVKREGLGLWDKKAVEEIGEWFGTVLRQS